MYEALRYVARRKGLIVFPLGTRLRLNAAHHFFSSSQEPTCAEVQHLLEIEPIDSGSYKAKLADSTENSERLVHLLLS